MEKTLPLTTELSVNSELEVLTEQEAIAVSKSSRIDLETNDTGVVKSTFINYCNIFEQDDYFKGKIRLNSMSNQVVLSGFFWDLDPHVIRDNDYNQLYRYTSKVYKLEDQEKIIKAVKLVANNNPFHPIVDRLNSLEWDGISRIDNLFPKYLGAEACVYTSAVTRLLFSGLIERIMRPGCKFDICVIISDTKQGTGKSSMCRLLALEDEFFSDSLRSLEDNKRAFEEIRGRWVIELGEMVATKSAKFIESIKSFLSRMTDVYREPYGKATRDYPRQCVFIGTTNKPQSLPSDKTGNRRFVILPCNGDKADVHPLADEKETRAYIQQCYAEMMVIRRKTGTLQLTVPDAIREEVLKLQQESAPDDTRVGMVQEFLDHCEEDSVCTRLIWARVFAGEYKRDPKRIDLDELADIMDLQIEGWKLYEGINGNAKDKRKKFPIYGKQKAWERIDKSTVRERIAEAAAGQDVRTADEEKDENPFEQSQ